MQIYSFVTTNTCATTVFALKFRLYLSLTMSITYLLLFFLCISLHACNARHLSTLDKKLEKKSHFSVKSDEKNGYDSFPKQLNEGNNKMDELVSDSEKPKNQRNTSQKVLKAMGKASGALKTESLVSVSNWRVPHKKPSEEHPEFNLDYAPPKTHPPSHN